MYKFKQDLAMAYFPDCEETPVEFRKRKRRTNKESAGKLLAREIHTNRPLMSALQTTNYSPQRKLLSPKQLQIIFSFLGEP